MQTRSLSFAALVICTAVASHVCGQDDNAKGGDPYAQLMPYVHHDFCAAVVIHPKRIAQSELGKSIDLPKLVAAALQDAELDPTRALPFVDPAKIDRLTVLADPFPGGDEAFFPALVVEYAEDTPGGELFRALWPDSHESLDDERLFPDLESENGTPINGYIAGPRMILIAPEPTLKKMLSKDPSPRNLLRRQLRGGPVDSEIIVEYASQPVLLSLLKLTGLTAAQLRSDPDTDEAAKTMLFDVTAASLDLRLREKPAIHASVRCDNLRSAAKIKDMLDGGRDMLLAVLEDAEARNGLKNELRTEFPPPVVALVDSPALKDLTRSPEFEQQGTEVKVKLEFPATALDLARRSAAEMTDAAHGLVVDPSSRPWTLAKEFQWKRKEQPLTLIDRDKGFAMLTGVHGRLAPGAEVSIVPDPDGDWTLRGTDHADLVGRAVAVPWFVDAEQPVAFQLWKKGEGNLTRLVHQRDGFCALLKIGGAFNGGGEQFRLRVGDDGYWGLNARSKAPGTRVRVMVVKLKKPGSFRGVVREHHWENGQQPVRLIHRDEGIAFLSGLAGSFQGGGEFARVRLDKDGYWYLEGRSKQGFLHAWATSIELTGLEPPSTILNPALKADQAIAALKELGFEFDDDNRTVEIGYPEGDKLKDDDYAHFRDLPEVTELTIKNTPLTDKGLAHLVTLKNLKRLTLNYSEITDEGLKLIGQLTSLEEFELGHAENVTVAGLMHLKPLTNLRELSVPGVPIGPGQMEFVREMRELKRFEFNTTERGIVEGDLETLGRLTKLESLDMGGIKALDSGTIRHLSNLKELVLLSLDDTSVTDRGLLIVREFPKLAVLRLHGTNVGDDGMRNLAGMSSLTDLNLSGTRVTGRGLALLKDVGVNSLTLSGSDVSDLHLEGLKEWKELTTLQVSGDYDFRSRRSIPNRITINGIKSISEMEQLVVLSLSDNPQITDAAVPYLSKLKKLVLLKLENTGITPAGGRAIAAGIDGLSYDGLGIREK